MASAKKTRSADDARQAELLSIPVDKRSRKEWWELRAINERRSWDYKEPPSDAETQRIKLDELDEYDPDDVKTKSQRIK